MVVGFNENGVDRPVILVELKRYIKGFGSISHDVARLLEFLELYNPAVQSTIAIGASAFLYRTDRRNTRIKQHNDVKKKLTAVLRKARAKAPSTITTQLYYRILHTSAFANEAEAARLVEDGRPAREETAPITIAAGMLLFHHPDRLHRLREIGLTNKKPATLRKLVSL